MDTQGEKLISSERYPQKARGMLMMAIASTCFSLGGLLIKMIPWNPLTINGVRNLIAACVIGGFIRLTQHPLKWNFTVLTGAVCMAGVTTFFTIANKLTTAGNAIVLQYSAPVWIILLSFLFFRDKPDRSQGITIGFVLAGILCFFFDSLSAGKILGDLLALLSGLFYAGMFMLNRFEKGDALSSMFFGQLLCGIFLSPFLVRETVFTPGVLTAVFVLGAVQVGLAYIFFSIGTLSWWLFFTENCPRSSPCSARPLSLEASCSTTCGPSPRPRPGAYPTAQEPAGSAAPINSGLKDTDVPGDQGLSLNTIVV